MSKELSLVSFPLCPYVQRVAIVMAEQRIRFERIDIDLARKPNWFLDISPLGKTPVLLVDGSPIFESSVICEYLEDIGSVAMHPSDPFQRAQHRSQMEFGSSILNAIAGFYNAPDQASLALKVQEIKRKFAHVESILAVGPFFAGESFSMVDAVYAPVFRYFETFDEIHDFGFFDDLPRVMAWRNALRARESVQSAIRPDFPLLLKKFLLARSSALSLIMQACANSTY
ncbi:MAG: glutathione S-transferase family protein [Undibacterium sp.]|nr:glutathione S-transferase family protein [Undibacterium sp.]